MDKIFRKYQEYEIIRSSSDQEYRQYFMSCTIEQLEFEKAKILKEDYYTSLATELRRRNTSKGWQGSLTRRFNWCNVPCDGTE
jgi:hypothetical protein